MITSTIMITWTLVIFIVAGGPSIVVFNFSNLEDCQALGALNVNYINPRARYNCLKMDNTNDNKSRLRRLQK